ncbi:MAG: hypothetical protein WC087_00550 [Candidatus Paceibacterota bacterium]
MIGPREEIPGEREFLMALNAEWIERKQLELKSKDSRTFFARLINFCAMNIAEVKSPAFPEEVAMKEFFEPFSKDSNWNAEEKSEIYQSALNKIANMARRKKAI